MTHYRGVAQLVARAVWDREVESSSLFTPTKKNPVHLGRFFLAVRLRFELETFADKQNSRKFGAAKKETRARTCPF